MTAGWRAGIWFSLWALAGAGAVLGVLTVLSIGIFVLPATAMLSALLAWRGDKRLAGPGIVAGLGLLPVYIGYLNRGGPGMVCTTFGTGQSCTQEWSPWPWLAAGLCLVTAGAVLTLRSSRARRTGQRSC